MWAEDHRLDRFDLQPAILQGRADDDRGESIAHVFRRYAAHVAHADANHRNALVSQVHPGDLFTDEIRKTAGDGVWLHGRHLERRRKDTKARLTVVRT